MASYIIQVIAFQLVFLIIYDAFLKRETFFNWNRLYLIASALISVVIPFIKIGRFKETIPQKFIINLPEVIIGDVAQNNETNLQLEALISESKPMFNWEIILYLGTLIAFMYFIFKILKIALMLTKNPKSKLGKLSIVKLQNSNAAFSFFHFIFLGERLNDNEKAFILKHEIIHVNEKHTLDLLFFEVLRILFWFNPLVYMYQNRIMSLHEFIADKKAIKNEDKASYYQSLLSQVFETNNISFINPFFKQSLIKKRIVMLQKSKSKQVNLLKYALLVPMVFGMLVYSSSYGQEKFENKNQELNLNQFDYTLNKSLSESTEEQLSKREDFLTFLKNNPEYIEWVIFDEENEEASFSIHHKSEAIPDGYEEGGSIGANGIEAISYYKVINKLNSKNENVVVKDYTDALDVPFGFVDQVPVFSGCETATTNEERKACMARGISDFVNKNFNTKIAEENKLIGRQRINVIFKIDTEGNITEVRSRAHHPALEAEAIRVINTLPKMIPGEHHGKKVNVLYSLPIVFQIADTKVND